MQVSVRVTTSFVPFFMGDLPSTSTAPKKSAPSTSAYRVPKASTTTTPVDQHMVKHAVKVGQEPKARKKHQMSLPANQPQYAKGYEPPNPFKHVTEESIAYEGIDFEEVVLGLPANETIPVICSSEREPMLPYSTYRDGRRYKRKVIGVGKRQPVTVTCYQKKTCDYVEKVILSCKEHIVKYRTANPQKPKYKDLRSTQFRVKQTRCNIFGTLIGN